MVASMDAASSFDTPGGTRKGRIEACVNRNSMLSIWDEDIISAYTSHIDELREQPSNTSF
ncbi:MAG: hypothetical protein ACFE8N_15100 [Promethearchaeota archaeon]